MRSAERSPAARPAAEYPPPPGRGHRRTAGTRFRDRQAARDRLTARAGWAAAAVLTVAAFAVYLRLAQTRAVNSDGAAQALQAWDMLHGNLLLHGWTTSDVSFYSTELPQYLLIELVRGLGPAVVQTGAALSYTLVVLLAALLAAGPRRRGAGGLDSLAAERSALAPGRGGLAGAALAAGIMLAPQLGAGTNVLLSSPDHTGTAAPLLLTWLVLDRVRPGWRVPLLTALLLSWAAVGDSIVFLAGVVPLAAVCGLRLARLARGRATSEGRRAGALRWTEVLRAGWLEASLGAGALAAAVIAEIALRLLHAAGGFTVRPLGPHLASLGLLAGHNLLLTGQCLLLLTGADVFAAPGGAATATAALHLAGAALAAAGIGLAVVRWRRLDLVSQVLLAAIAVNVAAFAVTDKVTAVSSAREIAPVLPFAAALAGRLLAPLLTRSRRPARSAAGEPTAPGRKLRLRVSQVTLGVVAAGYLAGLGVALTTPAAPPQAAALTAWLQRHPLGTGLSGYWAASIVTLTSGGRVAVRPAAVAGGRVRPNPAEVNNAWFDPRRTAAHYVVLDPGIPGYPGFTDQAAVRATFGPPARVYRAGQYTVWYWPANLLGPLAAGRGR